MEVEEHTELKIFGKHVSRFTATKYVNALQLKEPIEHHKWTIRIDSGGLGGALQGLPGGVQCMTKLAGIGPNLLAKHSRTLGDAEALPVCAK